MNLSNLRTCDISEMELNPSKLLFCYSSTWTYVDVSFLSGSHYHTQHPLELTNLLNGYDADRKTENRERWALALSAWED